MVKKQNLKVGIPIVVLCTLLIGLAQLLFKWGVAEFYFTIKGVLLNYSLVGGIALYAAGTLLLVYALIGIAVIGVIGPLIALLIYSNSKGIAGWSFEQFLLLTGLKIPQVTDSMNLASCSSA